MRCPTCQEDSDKVVDSRPAEEGRAIRRRRECQSCGARFTTFERIETVPLIVRKRDGRAEPYSAEKLRMSISRAAAERPGLAEQVEAMAADIESEVMLRHGQEIPTRVLGAEILERLKRLDDVAYLRYASVHKGFASREDFLTEIEALEAAGGGPERATPAPSSASPTSSEGTT